MLMGHEQNDSTILHQQSPIACQSKEHGLPRNSGNPARPGKDDGRNSFRVCPIFSMKSASVTKASSRRIRTQSRLLGRFRPEFPGGVVVGPRDLGAMRGSDDLVS